MNTFRAMARTVVNRDSCVASYVVSQREQTVRITGADCCVRLAKGEEIWTESSFK